MVELLTPETTLAPESLELLHGSEYATPPVLAGLGNLIISSTQIKHLSVGAPEVHGMLDSHVVHLDTLHDDRKPTNLLEAHPELVAEGNILLMPRSSMFQTLLTMRRKLDIRADNSMNEADNLAHILSDYEYEGVAYNGFLTYFSKNKLPRTPASRSVEYISYAGGKVTHTSYR